MIDARGKRRTCMASVDRNRLPSYAGPAPSLVRALIVLQASTTCERGDGRRDTERDGTTEATTS